jgi:GLPGLI family protein
MWRIVSFFFLFFYTVLNAQQTNFFISIEYDYTIQQSEITGFYQVRSLLKFDTDKSIYEIDHLNSFRDSYSKQEGANQITFGISARENDFVYKDFHKQEMFYSDRVIMQRFDVKDSLQLMEWTLNNRYKDILGYSCQEATALHRGRFYIAYFTTEIPVPNGPWQFHGLPGVILKVYSLDNVFKIEATSIEIKNESIEINNPFKDKDLISWKEYLSIYRKKYDEVIRNSMTEWGPSQTLPKKGIVEYIKD